MIPKTIIQTHESEYTFDNVAAGCRARLTELHPDFELRFFSAAARREFLSERRPELVELYDFYSRNEQKRNLFKMVAASELGGFCFDLPLHLHEEVDSLCSHELVFPIQRDLTAEEFEEMHGRAARGTAERMHLGMYAFGGEAGHEFFERVIDEMIARAEMLSGLGTSDFDVLISTGSGVINAVAHEFGDGGGEQLKLLKGRAKPPVPKPVAGRRPWWNQFGRYGSLLSAVE